MRTAPAVFELLRECVLGQLDPTLAEVVVAAHGPRTVVRAACWHGVENHLLRAIRDLPGEPLPQQELRALYEQSTEVHLRAIADLAALAPLLEQHGIPALVVKGPALAELYANPDLRAYSDLDIVVPRNQFAAAVNLLQGTGSRLLDLNWRRIDAEGRAQVHLAAPLGSSVDLHWHLINRGIARRGLVIDMDSLFARARETRLSGVSCLTTDPVDTALHVIVHTGVSGGVQLSQLADVRQALAWNGLDWDQLAMRARTWGAGEMAAIVIERVSRVLGLTLPDGTVARMRSSRGWSAVVRTIEPRARPELKGEGGLVARLTRAARETRSASARLTVAWLGFQTRGWVSRRVAARLGLDTPDGEREQRAYLASVARRI